MELFGDASLKKILSDKTSGSVELLHKLNNYLSRNRRDTNRIREIIPELKKHFRSFENIQKYLVELEKAIYSGKLSPGFFQTYKAEAISVEKMFSKALPFLKNRNTILTLSNSRTVYELLSKLQKVNKRLKVIVCESRPKLEGRIMASRLSKIGIKVQLITDAMMSEYIQQCNAVLIGADSVLRNGNVVNKVGSRALAVLCKEYKKPFYVAADKSKFSKKTSLVQSEENRKEIWHKAPKKIFIRNFYFERIPKFYITKIFSS